MDVYNDMSYYSTAKNYINKRRQRAIDGKYNCIPWPFKRFREFFPGTEMSRFIIVTANQKIGKTKFCDFVWVYEPLFFILEHPEVKVKILYFCLEETALKKFIEFECYLLYRLDNIRISPSELSSTDKDYPVSQQILDLLESEKYQRYIKKFEEIVEYITEDRNPTGINKRCRDFALSHGHLNFVKAKVKDSVTGKLVERDILDTVNPYTPDDPELYKIAILDNASNLNTEAGLSKMDTIEKMSKYAITLRNQLNYTFILIQHQAQAQEGIENFKLNKIKPSSDGLADCKKTTRDINMVIGLYSPYKYGIPEYEGYNIKKLRNNVRFMEVLEDRDYGSAGNICPLYFDGATSYFAELPKANDVDKMDKVYDIIEENKKKSSVLMIMIGKITKMFKKK